MIRLKSSALACVGLALITALAPPASIRASDSVTADPAPAPSAAGVLRVRSANSFDETVARLKADVTAKGIQQFAAIDQASLGAAAGIPIRRSTLVLFGNPPLGIQFLQSNPYSGLDWPVRMLVVEAEDGAVYVAWTDFRVIADRYAIEDRGLQFAMASQVAASIAAAAAGN